LSAAQGCPKDPAGRNEGRLESKSTGKTAA
jgi:hypothetical protein